MKIRTILRKLRDKRRTSVRRMSEKIAMAHSSCVESENDKSSPSFKLYMKLADALEINPVVLKSYFTGQAHEVAVSAQTGSMVDLTEVVKFYKEHASRLEAYKLRIDAELAHVKEKIKGEISES